MTVGEMPTLNHIRRFRPWYTAEKEWIISFDSEDIFEEGALKDFSSSYHVLGARLLGLPYHEFLLYMAKNHNGYLRGKKGYCHVAFKEQSDCNRACEELERQWRIVKEKLDLG